jgi:hypothetical protein
MFQTQLSIFANEMTVKYGNEAQFLESGTMPYRDTPNVPTMFCTDIEESNWQERLRAELETTEYLNIYPYTYILKYLLSLVYTRVGRFSEQARI